VKFLHFRHFLISSLLVGAAIFLPDNAYAENDKQSEERQSQKASVHATISMETEKLAVQTNNTAKVENSVPVNKTVELPEAAITNEGKGKEKPAKEIPTQITSEEPSMASQKIPEHAKANLRSKVKKDKKVAGFEKAEKNSKLVEKVLEPKKATNDIVIDSLHNTENEVVNKAQLGEIISTGKYNSTVSIKKNSIEPAAPDTTKQEEPPVSEEEIPKVSQAMNPTQRTNSSGWQSHDRLSNGLSTISFLEKWLVWSNHYEMKLVQPYLSRYARIYNQWVNAPPTQPPQEAPLLKTVARY
jgi:hypothetical protein